MTTLPVHILMEQYIKYVNTNKHPTVDTWLLMKGPVPLLTILSCYLYFVLKFGPRLMAWRKPFSLQPLLVAYNFLMVVYSIFLTTWAFVDGQVKYLYSTGCHQKENNPEAFLYNMSALGWWYFFSKIVELTDTVFLVLKKKQRQISFLHVYHHAATALYVWIHLKYLPGPQGIVVGILNSAVHIFMYSYYMVAAMGPRFHKYLWWKKYITSIQLVQFFLMFTYMASLLVFNCEQPKGVSVYFIFISIIFLLLFLDFYQKTYMKKAED